MDPNPSCNHLVDHLFRHESGKMIAVLTRLFGMHNLSLAEDVVQDAFTKAVQTWKYNNLPGNPSAWLMQVAKNRAHDLLRRKRLFENYSDEFSKYITEVSHEYVEQFFLDTEISDSQLRLIFACCHPALKGEDQLALTLKTISGFGIPEISKALLTPEGTIQKRLYRAKRFIKEHKIQLEIPSGNELLTRLEMVHTVLYLIFNEGYHSSTTDELIRRDLCAEAMRLCLLLCEHTSMGQPASYALLSLMCFQCSRFESRLDDKSSIILLAQQDRDKCDRELVSRGYFYLNHSSKGNQLTVYHVESAIAAEHCIAASFAETDFERLLKLYDLLLQIKPSPVVQLNRAVVLSYSGKTAEAVRFVQSIDQLDQLLATQYLFNAVLGELYIRNGQPVEAKNCIERALSQTTSAAEKKLLGEKLMMTGSVVLS